MREANIRFKKFFKGQPRAQTGTSRSLVGPASGGPWLMAPGGTNFSKLTPCFLWRWFVPCPCSLPASLFGLQEHRTMASSHFTTPLICDSLSRRVVVTANMLRSEPDETVDFNRDATTCSAYDTNSLTLHLPHSGVTPVFNITASLPQPHRFTLTQQCYSAMIVTCGNISVTLYEADMWQFNMVALYSIPLHPPTFTFLSPTSKHYAHIYVPASKVRVLRVMIVCLLHMSLVSGFRVASFR